MDDITLEDVIEVLEDVREDIDYETETALIDGKCTAPTSALPAPCSMSETISARSSLPSFMRCASSTQSSAGAVKTKTPGVLRTIFPS